MPIPKIIVRADFDNDGDFEDPDSDISSRVMGGEGHVLKVVRGKDLAKHRFPAAVCDFQLRNDDHKYSPSKSTSPLYPGLILWNVWVMVGYPVDDFNASDTTTLTSRKPSHDSLFAAWEGDTGDFDVLSNKIRTATGANKSAVLDFGETDCFVGVKFTRGGIKGGLVIRWSDVSNFLLVYPDGTKMRLAEIVSGTLTSIKDVSFTWGSGDEKWIFAELHGDDIRVSVDNNLQFTHTTTRFNDKTKHGIGGHVTHANDRWEDFGGWRSVFYGRRDSVDVRPHISEQQTLVRAFDDMERMAMHQVQRSAPSGGNVDAKAILDVILDAVDFSSANRIIDDSSGDTPARYLTISNNHEKVMGRDGLTEAYQVMDDDVGQFWLDGQGYVRYEDPKHRHDAPHQTALKTWYEKGQSNDETDIYFTDLEYDDGKDRVENEAYYRYARVARVVGVTVWRLEVDDEPTIDNESTIDLTAVGEGDVIANPVLPHHATDWNLNSEADGSGTDLLAAVDTQGAGTVVASGSSAFTLDDTTQNFKAVTHGFPLNDGKHQVRIKDATGRSAYGWIATTDPDGNGTKVDLKTGSGLATAGYAYKQSGFDETDTPLTYNVYDVTVELVTGFEGNFRLVRLVNNSGSKGYLKDMRLRADKGTYTNKTAGRAEIARSQALIGRRRVVHDALHIDKHATAENRAATRVSERGPPKERLVFDMPNGTRANLMQILHRSISDRVTMNFSAMGINEDYFLERQTIKITDGGMKVDCTWEAVAVSSLWDWGIWGGFYYT